MQQSHSAQVLLLLEWDVKDDNYKMAASSRLPRGGGGGNTLQDDPFIDVNEMKTEIFALPGLPFDDTLYNYNIQFDAAAGEDDQNRGSRQMCLDGREENCFSLDPTTSFGNDFGSFNRDMWVMPMLGLAAMNVLVILAYEIFVICKATGNSPSRRHLFLGQMLLLGLLLGSTVGFAYAVPVKPNEFSCAAIRLGTGLAYGLIYSSLLVKLVFLISLNTGVYLPATYQALLFLFCLIVQVVIGIQWLATSTRATPSCTKPQLHLLRIKGIISEEARDSLCCYTTVDHLLSLLYVMFLIIFVTCLAVKSWSFRDNYRESKYIGVLMAVTIPSWLAWTLSSYVLNESFAPGENPCFGFGLIGICLITFVIMFVPKSRQLSAIGKEGIYLEDHDHVDRFSYRSNDPNNYSPSFYHFRPSKTSISRPGGSIRKESRPGSPFYKAGNSYTGFHRPLRVVPPTASPQPPSYTARTPYFPSHFFPEKLHQYWQYYYPRIPEMYRRHPGEHNIYTSLYDPDRSKSANPNVYFYKTAGYPQGFIY